MNLRPSSDSTIGSRPSPSTSHRRPAMWRWMRGRKTLLEYYWNSSMYRSPRHAILETLWNTGARLGDVYGLNRGDVDREEAHITLRLRPESDSSPEEQCRWGASDCDLRGGGGLILSLVRYLATRFQSRWFRDCSSHNPSASPTVGPGSLFPPQKLKHSPFVHR